MKTWGWKTFLVKKNERGLLLRDGDFVKLLPPGQHRIRAWGHQLDLERFSLSQSAFEHPLAEYLMNEEPALIEREFVPVRLADDEIGLLYEDGLLADVLPPGSRRLYWKAMRILRVEVLPLPHDLRIDQVLVQRLQRMMERKSVGSVDGVLLSEVPQHHLGLLWVDGQVQECLQAGVHGFWQYGRTVQVQCVDMRAQTAEVSGQEILSRDKVGLRLNLSAIWRYADVLQCFSKLARPAEHVYRELQFALRKAVGQRTIDDLLGDKAAIDVEIRDAVAGRLADTGIVLDSVGVKDIILPGEMRSILAQVVEAEKAAQANLIRRREETAATRSLLNTARVMEDNPIALRMKELETLERVADRIDRISVVGGLDQVLNGLVKLR